MIKDEELLKKYNERAELKGEMDRQLHATWTAPSQKRVADPDVPGDRKRVEPAAVPDRSLSSTGGVTS